jgi:hypothetical protein
MRQPAPIQHSGEDRPEPAEAATEIGAKDEFDRSFAFVSGVCLAAVAVMAALAILWPA